MNDDAIKIVVIDKPLIVSQILRFLFHIKNKH